MPPSLFSPLASAAAVSERSEHYTVGEWKKLTSDAVTLDVAALAADCLSGEAGVPSSAST